MAAREGVTAADIEAAELLVAYETAHGGAGVAGSAQEPVATSLRVYEKLADRLAPLIGTAGFAALVDRSLKLTKTEHPCFEELCVPHAYALLSDKDKDGAAVPTAAERLRACLSKLNGGDGGGAMAVAAAAIALYATLLGLLRVFIGEQLVWQVLRGAFPALGDDDDDDDDELKERDE